MGPDPPAGPRRDQARRSTGRSGTSAPKHSVRSAPRSPRRAVDPVVDLVTDHTLDAASVRLTPAGDGIDEPDVLRRADGTWVYEVAGSDLHQPRSSSPNGASSTPPAAPTARADPNSVDLALLEQAANGTTLNPGQASPGPRDGHLRARLQLAIAPAGTGKTTAMRALAAAWTEQRRHRPRPRTLRGRRRTAPHPTRQTGATADNLAKLVWAISHRRPPDWAAAIGPDTLVIIDEAGMADTLTLDHLVTFVPRPRRQRPTRRRRPATRRDRRRRRPARHRRHPRRPPPRPR